MSLFVDTGVWSLTFRRDAPASSNERRELVRAIEAGEELVTAGLVLQELLQGFSGPTNRAQILDLLDVWAAEVANPKLKREAALIWFGLHPAAA